MEKEWVKAYQLLKKHAVCLDIETTRWNGPIAIVGLFRPKEGPIQVTQLISGKNLDEESIKQALQGVKLIITFNGDDFDLPRIRRQFPTALPPGVKTLDLYAKAKELDLKAGLKILEAHFNISRPEWMENRRRIAVRLWKRYQNYHDKMALKALLEYNAQDAINLYPLAEQLAKKAVKRRAILNAIDECTKA